MPLSLAHQARCLRRLTGLPLVRCRRAMDSVAPVGPQPRTKQMELEDAPLAAEQVASGFAECRRRLGGSDLNL
jgi:hypothetical protein